MSYSLQRMEEHLRMKYPLEDWKTIDIHERAIQELEKEKSETKIIIAHCIYNEEQFLAETLEDDLNINDLTAIHILDGAWRGGGDSYISTDKTRDVVRKFSKKHPEILVWLVNEPDGKLWLSEPVKRNYQLQHIESLFKQVPYYVIVKDGDELFHFTTGRKNLWLAKMFEEQNGQVGLVDAYGWNSDVKMIGVRFIPSHKNIHYYTGKIMTVHDADCNLIMDYNPNRQFVSRECFLFESFVLINKWNLRHSVRIEEKLLSDDAGLSLNEGACQYTKYA